MKSRRPKVLHDVCGLPMLAHVLAAARAATDRAPVVIVSPATASVRDAFPEGVTFALQAEPLGTADAVRAALATSEGEHADEVVVLSGDTPLLDGESVRLVLDARRARSAAIALGTVRPPEPRG